MIVVRVLHNVNGKVSYNIIITFKFIDRRRWLICSTCLRDKNDVRSSRIYGYIITNEILCNLQRFFYSFRRSTFIFFKDLIANTILFFKFYLGIYNESEYFKLFDF